MSDKRISQLNNYDTSLNDDLLVIVDILNEETKKQTKANFLKEIVEDITSIEDSITVITSDLDNHITDTGNPHNVTKTQVGLGNADNTSDLNKPISTATQTALNAKLDVTLKGANSGLAELDETGKVPSSQLPSYVDDVIVVDTFTSLPVTGEAGKIYITSDTNITYRWSGSAYVEISASLALGETSSTAYRGDRGKIAYDHSQETGNPHNTQHSQLGGLGNDDHAQYELTCADQQVVTNYTFDGSEPRNGGYQVNTTASNRTINIDPDLFATGYSVTICKGTNNASIVTIDAGTGNNIDGSQTLILTDYNETVTLIKDGANTWKIKSHYFAGLRNELNSKLNNTAKSDPSSINGASDEDTYLSPLQTAQSFLGDIVYNFIALPADSDWEVSTNVFEFPAISRKNNNHYIIGVQFQADVASPQNAQIELYNVTTDEVIANVKFGATLTLVYSDANNAVNQINTDDIIRIRITSVGATPPKGLKGYFIANPINI